MNKPLLTHKPKIIFFDIDNTLYINQENRIPHSVKTALHLLKAQNIIIAIATGRGICVFPPCVMALIQEIGIELFVTINGQYNQFQGAKLVDFAMTKQDVHNATQALIHHDIAYGYMTYDKILTINPTPAMYDALDSLHTTYQVIDDINLDTNEPIYQMLAFYDQTQQLDLMLSDTLKVTRWHKNGVDILQKEGSKVRGIRAVLDKLGLSLVDAMAFGDGLNDMQMLQAVGFGVAMGNAHPQLQAVADFICPRHNQDGIYWGLKTLGII